MFPLFSWSDRLWNGKQTLKAGLVNLPGFAKRPICQMAYPKKKGRFSKNPNVSKITYEKNRQRRQRCFFKRGNARSDWYHTWKKHACFLSYEDLAATTSKLGRNRSVQITELMHVYGRLPPNGQGNSGPNKNLKFWKETISHLWFWSTNKYLHLPQKPKKWAYEAVLNLCRPELTKFQWKKTDSKKLRS